MTTDYQSSDNISTLIAKIVKRSYVVFNIPGESTARPEDGEQLLYKKWLEALNKI